MVDDKPVTLGLWDTAGQGDYDRMRPLCYPDTDVFLICFGLNSRASFENVKSKWHKEILSHEAKAKIILIGNKCDLRKSASTVDLVSKDEAQRLCDQLGIKFYYECSAKSQEGMKEVFEAAARLGMAPVDTKS
eukprot:TRINITY_DN2889_c0_g1_i2.p1 TRINITY_DN2889_c0_g1~~TRINITY_DN2889_c0_g1_i2.p1  ORF type:complete len:133 (+),score=33.51 TRINITY_DN2889_c0_g1_i2:413-811(+)